MPTLPIAAEEDIILEPAAAQILKVPTSTLARWRRNGKAPPHFRYPASSVVRYRHADVTAWLAAQVAGAKEGAY